MLAVLDTQIIIRGLLKRRISAATRVFDRAISGEFTGVVSPIILAEVRKTLRTAKSLSLDKFSDDLIKITENRLRSKFLVTPGNLRSKYPLIQRDHSDTPLVEAALESGASYIVTEDVGVLSEKEVDISGFETISILPPNHFLKII